MSDPLIFVSTHRPRAGRDADLRVMGSRFATFVETNEPRTAGLQIFVDERTGELTYVQVQPDAAAMDDHLRIAGERIGQALEAAETVTVTVYGRPGPILEQALRANAEAGAAVTVLPTRVGGFLRGAAG
jgi:nucleotide-binding universal stress UspA family protein